MPDEEIVVPPVEETETDDDILDPDNPKTPKKKG